MGKENEGAQRPKLGSHAIVFGVVRLRPKTNGGPKSATSEENMQNLLLTFVRSSNPSLIGACRELEMSLSKKHLKLHHLENKRLQT